jgi:dipeptidyl aminopeptidase/acylaminoacyl peptidase
MAWTLFDQVDPDALAAWNLWVEDPCEKNVMALAAHLREDFQHWDIENMGDPNENYARWYANSPYFFLDRLRAPVQLICAENDPRCPVEDSQETYEKLKSLSKEVDFILYRDEGHAFLKMENLVDSEMRRVAFLASVLDTDHGQPTTDD